MRAVHEALQMVAPTVQEVKLLKKMGMAPPGQKVLVCVCVCVNIYIICVHIYVCLLKKIRQAQDDMYTPPHMTHVSSSSYDTCILLLI